MASKLIENIIKDNMMDYSSYVLLNRALPSLEDGMKPVHRRILFAMHKEKATKLTKSANINGAVMKYHPHGDSYPTIVNMTQIDRHNTPFIEGKGNFGQATSRDLDYGAMRYTEVKLSPMAIDSMQNFDKDIVDFIPNYDGTLTMPKHLPVRFPNVLVMANEGIGVGMSSNTPSFNLKEVCEATEHYIQTGEHIELTPDFATGGFIVVTDEEIAKMNQSGRGSVTLRSDMKVIAKNKIEVTEIPFNTTREAIIEKIIGYAKDGKLPVANVQDLTGFDGQRILITAKRGTDIEKLQKDLYKLTPLETTYTSNMNILVDGLPKVLGTHEIIEKWVVWRSDCIKRGISYDIKQLEKKLHILYGMRSILSNLDRVIEIIRFEEEEQIDPMLMKEFNLTEQQSVEISKMRLRDISKKNIEKKIQEIADLERKLAMYTYVLNHKEEIDKVVVNGLRNSVKTFGKDRKTKIIKN